MSKLEEIEARRAARKDALEAQRQEQRAVDLERLDELECEYGDGRVAYVEAPSFTSGLPSMAIVRAPKREEYKRFRDKVSAAKGSGPGAVEAQDQLASVTVVYPEKDVYAKMCERSAGLHVACAIVAAKLAEGKAADEKNV